MAFFARLREAWGRRMPVEAPGPAGGEGRRASPGRARPGAPTEPRLRASELRYRRLFETAKDGILILDADTGAIMDANPFVRDLLGFRPEELRGKRLSEIGVLRDTALSEVAFAELQRGGYIRYEDLPLQAKDGREIAVEFVSNVYDEDSTRVIQCNIRDITRRKLVERTAAESAARYRDLYENAPIAYFSVSAADGTVVDCNLAAQRLLGTGRDTLVGADVLGLYADTPRGKAAAKGVFERFIAGEAIRDAELQMRRADGTAVDVSLSVEAKRDATGQITESRSAAIDITARKHAQREIESLSRFPAEDPDPVLRVSQDGVILYANRASAPLLGTWERRVGETIPAEWAGWIAEAVASGANRTVETWVGSGSYECIIAPIVGTGHVNVYGRNTTERRQLEERLRQSQKMEAVARLAGGVAHDFNNLLGVIAGYAELMVRQLPEESAHRQRLEQILKASGRAAGLTRQLLAFGRRQLLQPRVLFLGTVLASVEELLRRVIGEDIELRVHSDPDLWPVLADAGQIEQVLMNLAINARDAMPDGGELVFGLANVADVAFPANGISDGVRGPHVLLAVSDTGSGMDEMTQSRLFEPFFTTKEPGKGTGLGLATVYGIVRQSGGHVEVESEPGRGSTFKVFLPRAEGVAEPEDAGRAGEAGQAALGGSETILLVEDETALRLVIRETLEAAGYTVLHTASPTEAIAQAQTHEGRIHLLLTDVIMPEMNGRALAERVRSVRPDVRALFMSGYADEALGSVLDPTTHLIEKPFRPEVLLKKLRDMLAG